MAISGAGSTIARSQTPVIDEAASVSDQAPSSEGTTPPLLKNSLPYARADYEKVEPPEKTPLLDFLILGKTPDLSQFKSESPVTLHGDFSIIVSQCLLFGEANAIDFLWRKSGLNPNDCIVYLPRMMLNESAVTELQMQCRAHPGLTFDLDIHRVDSSVVPGLATLIGQGKVCNLTLDVNHVPSKSLSQLAAVLGQVRESLTMNGAKFDIHSEKALADSLEVSPSLKRLRIENCDFGPSKGLQFVESIQRNDSITHLFLSHSTIETSLGNGYCALIRNNTRLEHLGVLGAFGESIDVDSVLLSAVDNKSLRYLSLHYPNRSRNELRFSESLFHLVEKNRTLTTLKIPVALQSEEDYRKLADLMKENTSLIYLELRRDPKMTAAVKTAIDDILDRNFALANGPTLRKAGEAFDPYGAAGRGMADVGSVIARNILQNSSSLNEFANTMAYVELSMRELTLPEPATITTLTSNASTIATTTLTTSITTSPTTTTTTTTTNAKSL